MKKVLLMICITLLVSACGSDQTENEKQVVCKLEENEQSGVEVAYTYDKDKNITKIHNVSFLNFSEDDLKSATLDEYYEQITAQYEEAEGESGVEVKINKDEDKKRITMDVNINLAIYDIEKDILNIGNNGEMENIEDTVGLYEAMGVYACGEIK
ncbi:MAG: hypothetical protein PHQ89_04905 [Bacilli bacterium]|nr:hypothetical protein [Bacilli bacterium]